MTATDLLEEKLFDTSVCDELATSKDGHVLTIRERVRSHTPRVGITKGAMKVYRRDGDKFKADDGSVIAEGEVRRERRFA